MVVIARATGENSEETERREQDSQTVILGMVSTSHSTLKVTLPLVPRGNRPITAAELVKRLTSLSNQLIETGQDNAAIKGQLERTIAPQLVDKNILQHKDKGVKSYVALCIVEALRICAPDAPFNASQLKVRQVFHTQGTDSRKFSNYSLNNSSSLNLPPKLTTRILFTFSKASNKRNVWSSSTTLAHPPPTSSPPSSSPSLISLNHP